MGPMARRQYGANASRLNGELERDLLWRRNTVGDLPPLSIPLTMLAPTVAHSDDQGRGHIEDRRVLIPCDVSVPTHRHPRFVQMKVAADGESAIYLFGLASTSLNANLRRNDVMGIPAHVFCALLKKRISPL